MPKVFFFHVILLLSCNLVVVLSCCFFLKVCEEVRLSRMFLRRSWFDIGVDESQEKEGGKISLSILFLCFVRIDKPVLLWGMRVCERIARVFWRCSMVCERIARWMRGCGDSKRLKFFASSFLYFLCVLCVCVRVCVVGMCVCVVCAVACVCVWWVWSVMLCVRACGVLWFELCVVCLCSV